MKKLLNKVVTLAKRLIYLKQGWSWCNKVFKIRGYKATFKKELCENYKKLWSPLSRIVLSKYLKVFATKDLKEEFIPYIAPEDLVHHYIEPVLNPYPYRGFMEDKNNFGRLIPSEFLPKEHLHWIQGIPYDEKYERISEEALRKKIQEIAETTQHIIVKPTINSCSGNGIKFYNWNGRLFVDKDGNPFDEISAYTVGSDFVVQEVFEQSPFMSQFCRTSVNTLRIVTYRSVKDDVVHVPAMIMRMGKEGAMVDNAHAGGCFIGVSPVDGSLGKYVCDQWGRTEEIFNGIDFSKSSYTIPNFDSVLNFAKKIAEKIPYHRLLALDVVLDKNGLPKLIEYNVSGFSTWLFPPVGQVPFGKWTEEIVLYCKEKKHLQRLWMV